MAIDLEPHVQILRIGDFVRSYEPVKVTTLDGRSFNGILKKDAASGRSTSYSLVGRAGELLRHRYRSEPQRPSNEPAGTTAAAPAIRPVFAAGAGHGAATGVAAAGATSPAGLAAGCGWAVAGFGAPAA